MTQKKTINVVEVYTQGERVVFRGYLPSVGTQGQLKLLVAHEVPGCVIELVFAAGQWTSYGLMQVEE